MRGAGEEDEGGRGDVAHARDPLGARLGVEGGGGDDADAGGEEGCGSEETSELTPSDPDEWWRRRPQAAVYELSEASAEASEGWEEQSIAEDTQDDDYLWGPLSWTPQDPSDFTSLEEAEQDALREREVDCVELWVRGFFYTAWSAAKRAIVAASFYHQTALCCHIDVFRAAISAFAVAVGASMGHKLEARLSKVCEKALAKGHAKRNFVRIAPLLAAVDATETQQPRTDWSLQDIAWLKNLVARRFERFQKKIHALFITEMYGYDDVWGEVVPASLLWHRLSEFGVPTLPTSYAQALTARYGTWDKARAEYMIKCVPFFRALRPSVTVSDVWMYRAVVARTTHLAVRGVYEAVPRDPMEAAALKERLQQRRVTSPSRGRRSPHRSPQHPHARDPPVIEEVMSIDTRDPGSPSSPGAGTLPMYTETLLNSAALGLPHTAAQADITQSLLEACQSVLARRADVVDDTKIELPAAAPGSPSSLTGDGSGGRPSMPHVEAIVEEMSARNARGHSVSVSTMKAGSRLGTPGGPVAPPRKQLRTSNEVVAAAVARVEGQRRPGSRGGRQQANANADGAPAKQGEDLLWGAGAGPLLVTPSELRTALGTRFPEAVEDGESSTESADPGSSVLGMRGVRRERVLTDAQLAEQGKIPTHFLDVLSVVFNPSADREHLDARELLRTLTLQEAPYAPVTAGYTLPGGVDTELIRSTLRGVASKYRQRGRPRLGEGSMALDAVRDLLRVKLGIDVENPVLTAIGFELAVMDTSHGTPARCYTLDVVPDTPQQLRETLLRPQELMVSLEALKALLIEHGG